MQAGFTRSEALQLLMEYNQEPFHIRHALTVEGVMCAFADNLGFQDEKEFWGIVGLLHDIDYERYPDQHCIKAPEILRKHGGTEELIRAVVSHTYGIHTDVMPEHLMEKILFATDELTGLIGAAAKMRPSKSTKDMELRSLKKKYKDKRFAAGCSREVIKQGADMLEWTLDDLLEKTILAMRVDEDNINDEMKALGLEA
ncbi:MAG TPA: HDIG domain-containing protein [Clostridiales bacterium]|jgi:putative nucleotidyltransferase with HDIG domain|nr:HDIG domain-containing protein [Clostridiales bacterium]